jgi:hypothetical protein
MRTVFILLVVLCVLGCGGGAKYVPPPAEAPTVPPAQKAPASWDVLDAILPGAEITVQADVATIRDLPFFKAGVRLSHTRVPVDLLADLMGKIALLERHYERCGFSPLRSLEQIAMSEGRDGAVLAAEFDRPPSAVLACFKILVPTAEPDRFRDVEALRIGDRFVLGRGNIVWMGDKSALQKALDRPAQPAERAKLRATPDTVFAAQADSKRFAPLGRMDARVRGGHEELALDVEMKLASANMARDLATQILDAKARAVAAKGFPDSVDLKVTPTGEMLRLHIGARGNLAVQAEAIGGVMAMGIFVVRHFQAQWRAAEAKNTVASIGKSLQAAYQRDRKVFPPSGQPVPKQVPKGTRSVPTAADWQVPGWKDIGFSITEAVYHQYEFVTSPDGKRVTVRARGDLDGDGKQSLIELKLSLDPKGDVVTAPLSVKDELQ